MSLHGKRYLFVFFLGLIPFLSFADKCKNDSIKLERIDSLANAVTYRNADSAINIIWNGLLLANKIDCPDSTRNYLIANMYFRMGNVFLIKGDYSLAIDYLNVSLRKYLELKYFRLASENYHQIGYAYMLLDNYSTALEFYKYSYLINKLKKDEKASSNLINMGSCYIQLGQYQNALSAFLESLKIKEEFNDINGITNCNVNIGAIHYILKNYNEARNYYLKALTSSIADSNLLRQAQIYNNIGLIYMSEKKFDEADEAYHKAVKLYRQLNQLRKEGATLNNLGKNALLQKKFDLANKYYNEYKIIAEKLNDKSSLAFVYQNLGEINKNNGNYKKALDNFLYSLKMLEEIGQVFGKDQMYLSIAETYSESGNFRKSTEWYKKAVIIRDSIFSIETANQMNELEKKFQTEKKQKEIEIQQEQLKRQKAEIDIQNEISEKQRFQRNALIVGFVLSILIIFLVFRSYLQKKRTNRILTQQKEEIEAQRDKLADLNNELSQKNEEIIAQRDEIECQRDLLMIRKNQLEKVNHEITDSIRYAKRIQGAMMPSEKQLDEIFNEYFLLFRPRDIVSGDFYWAGMRNEWLIFCVADCTGHGVPGAFMSLLGISYLNEIVKDNSIKTTSSALNELRKQVVESLKQQDSFKQENMMSGVKDGMDISLCVLNTKTHVLQFAGANNPCWIIKKTGGFEELSADKMPVAIHTIMEDFSEQSVQLEKGDLIYLLSDGYADQFGGKSGRKFMKKNLRELIISNSDETCDVQKQRLEEAFDEWTKGHLQVDDVTILGFRV